MESIWSKTTKIEEHPKLNEDINTEVAIIGGGLAGILTAYFLQKSGIKVIVIEGDRIGKGQTKNTTAKITSQHNLIYEKLIQKFGEEQAREYAVANQKAIVNFQKIIKDYNISCQFEERSAYLYSTATEDIKTLENEARCAAKLGIDAEFTTKTRLPFPVTGAVRFKGQAQFHPLEFMKAVSKDLTIYENTKVKVVEGNLIQTDLGNITADQIVFTTHYPFVNFPGYYFVRQHQERSYVIALENTQELEGMYKGIDKEPLSFRNSGELTLLGGGGHRTGDNKEGGKYEFLRGKAKEFWPDSKEVSCWSAQDCITLDGVPYIGHYSQSTPNWYVATGFGKWGMTSSMVSAMVISDMIHHKGEVNATIFSPSRFTPSASAKTFLIESGQAVKGLSKQIFLSPSVDISDLKEGHGGVVDSEGEKVGVYKDDNGKVFLVSTRCPHLGCQLEWNPDEKTWDCPCHGSRFDYTGKLIDNPAQEDLRNVDYDET